MDQQKPVHTAGWEKVLERNPRHDGAHKNLGWAYAWAERWEEALAHFREAVRINPDNASAYRGLGNTYSQNGNWAEAVPAFRECLAIGSEDTGGVYHELALALMAGGQRAAARQEWQHAADALEDDLQRNPGPEFAQVTRALLAEVRQRLDELSGQDV